VRDRFQFAKVGSLISMHGPVRCVDNTFQIRSTKVLDTAVICPSIGLRVLKISRELLIDAVLLL
jgi:hypothetical protein